MEGKFVCLGFPLSFEPPTGVRRGKGGGSGKFEIWVKLSNSKVAADQIGECPVTVLPLQQPA